MSVRYTARFHGSAACLPCRMSGNDIRHAGKLTGGRGPTATGVAGWPGWQTWNWQGWAQCLIAGRPCSDRPLSGRSCLGLWVGLL